MLGDSQQSSQESQRQSQWKTAPGAHLILCIASLLSCGPASQQLLFQNYHTESKVSLWRGRAPITPWEDEAITDTLKNKPRKPNQECPEVRRKHQAATQARMEHATHVSHYVVWLE